MRICFNKIVPTTLLFSVFPYLLQAADGDSENTGFAHFNAVLIGLISLIIILLFAILILGNTLRQLAIVYRDKMRSNKTAKTLLLLIVLTAGSYSSYAADVDATAQSAPKLIGGLAASDFYLLTGIIGLELLVVFSLVFTLRVLVRLVSNKSVYETEGVTAKVPKINFWDRFNKVVPIEKEHDILLDHNYDGIQELDNSLPPWWKYGFYLTILVAFVYIWYYHAGGNGPSSYDEYIAEVQKGEEAKASYLAKAANSVDENTVKMLDESGIAAGQSIFQTACAACHAKDGGGGVGPNLTDDYWLHGGGLKDVFKTIKYGWPDKGMKSWKDDYSPAQIAQIACYVKSLHGTKPLAPKDKQGELYQEGTAPVENADSTKTVAANP